MVGSIHAQGQGEHAPTARQPDSRKSFTRAPPLFHPPPQWDAWNSKKGLSKEEAEIGYVKMLETLKLTHKSTKVAVRTASYIGQVFM